MYSDAIEVILGRKKITPGDSIRLTSGDKRFEGVLMQRPDTGDNSILVIKLNNGYNAGIKFGSGSEIEKIRTGNKALPQIKEDLKFKSNLNKVSLIYTGGTIGSKIDYMTGGVYMLTRPEELLQKVPELTDIADLKVRHLLSMASEDMSYIEWQKIAKEVAESFNDGARGVMITHGTDTMHYTSAALSFMLENIKGPVVITGAQRSSDRGSSDAFVNLICAAHLAAKGDMAEIGICMHENSSDNSCLFIRGTHVRKMHTSARGAFKPVNSRPIARIGPDGGMEHISGYKRTENNDSKAKAVTGFDPKVALTKVHPNSDPDILNYYKDKGYKGVIIEGTGLGHLPVSTPHSGYNWLKTVRDVVDSGMIVGLTSQCVNGRVSPTVYRNLRLLKNAGAIYCEDMMPEVAYVKLGWLFGNYRKREVEEMLPKNMVGEISRRSEVDWME